MDDEGRLVAVSNRLPQIAEPATEEERQELPVGGLVSALRAALEKRGGLWLGWSGLTADAGEADGPAVSEIGRIRLAAMDLPRGEVNLFYNAFSNRTLWPLLHSFPAKMAIRHDAYRAYRRVNRRFAETLLPLLTEGDLVWVHDYHLIPLGHELRSLGWRGDLGYFLHTPFPPAEVFSLLPWARELLNMLLSYDLVGLQTRQYQQNLLDGLSTEVGGAVIGDTFTDGVRSSRVKVYPIGIDSEEIGRMAREADGTGGVRYLRRISPRHQIVLGVDRLDYTKGIAQRLMTFEHVLEHYPGLRGQVSMVQISAPSRSRVPEYAEERRQVDQVVGRINGRFSEAGWVPVHYLYRSYPQSELVAYYRQADVGLVTPLRDGMNLVAKEFVAAQGDDPGAVVLSRFCGAADTMKEALLVNPYDQEQTTRAIYQALRMPRRERLRRRDALMQGIRAFGAKQWSEAFLSDLATPQPSALSVVTAG